MGGNDEINGGDDVDTATYMGSVDGFDITARLGADNAVVFTAIGKDAAPGYLHNNASSPA